MLKRRNNLFIIIILLVGLMGCHRMKNVSMSTCEVVYRDNCVNQAQEIDSITLLFKSYFEDTVHVFMNNKHLTSRMVKTNLSTDFSYEKIKISSKKKTKVRILYKEDLIKFHIGNVHCRYAILYTPSNNLDYSGENNTWMVVFTDEPYKRNKFSDY